MERLAKLCKPSRYLTFSQLLILQKICEKYNIKVVFVHKFLIKIISANDKAFLKINPFDNEFFFISKTHSLKTFSSFHEFRQWFDKEYLEGCAQYE